jgi:uncharacterized protein YdeI (YjbR/CyaY-like superfamily)
VFYKKGVDELCLSYDEALDNALCFGWIDSMVRRIDGHRYARKFTPRRPGSIWSKSNMDRVERLLSLGRMTEFALTRFQERSDRVSLAEKFKVDEPSSPAEFLEALKKNRQAWDNFQKFAPSYRRSYLLWIMSAKASATRARRIVEAVDLISRNVKSLMK